MCLACRSKRPQAELVRFTAVDGRLIMAAHGRTGGRGVYCCRTPRCLRRFFKNKKGLARALRCGNTPATDTCEQEFSFAFDGPRG